MDCKNKPQNETDGTLQLCLEDVQLRETVKQRKQCLENLRKQTEEVLKEIDELEELNLSYDLFLQCQDVEKRVKEAEDKWEIVSKKKEEVKKLKEDQAQLEKTKRERLEMVEKLCVYQRFLQNVIKMTKFEDVQALINHLENLFWLRDKLSQSESISLEQVDRQRKELLTLEDKHGLVLVHKNNQLSQLQSELEKYRSEARIWEQKWSQIQETAAKKTLMLGQIKMASLNLFELTGGSVGEDGVDMNDTETQLERTRIFIQDREDIVKQHQFSLQNDSDKKDKIKSNSKHRRPKKYIKK